MTRGAEQRRRAAWGAAAAIVMTAGAGLVWGVRSAVAAAVLGVIATLLQMLAARAMARTGIPAALDHLKVYLMGVLLRLLGVVVLAIAVVLDRTIFPPLAAAAGYLGTVLPLLYLETRLSR